MNAHVSTSRVPLEHIDEFAAAIQSMLPQAKKQSVGLERVVVLGDRNTGKILFLSEWESEAAAQAAEPVYQNAMRELGQYNLQPPVRERYEVLLQG